MEITLLSLEIIHPLLDYIFQVLVIQLSPVLIPFTHVFTLFFLFQPEGPASVPLKRGTEDRYLWL
ncbi:MAG: hypothetical protein IPF54_03435 [Draconibacterium sp.]|nr:hypothetical protein [Draconibacterium sp.]